MTAQTIVSQFGMHRGSTVTIEPRGRLTLDGRMYRVLSIDGAPAPDDTWIRGRDLSLGAREA